MISIIFITYLLFSNKQKATLLMFLEGDTSSVFDWLTFYYGWTKFGFSRLHLDLTCIPYCITGSTFTGCQSLGFTTVFFFISNGNLQNYRNTLPGGTLALMLHYS